MSNKFIWRHCAVADELNGLIYMVGGVTTYDPNRRKLSRQYNIGLDKWENMYDNSLPYDADDCSVAIMHNHHNGRRRLVVHASYSTRVQLMWLDPQSSWTTMTSSITSMHSMRVISVTKFEHYLVGGYTSRHGGRSTRWIIRMIQYHIHLIFT